VTYGIRITGVPFFDLADPGVWLPVDLADIRRIGNAARPIFKGLKTAGKL